MVPDGRVRLVVQSARRGVHNVRDNTVAFFDATLDFAPVSIQGNDPIIPEDRFVFELIGLERSEPDQYRKNGGIKWTWRVFQDDGRTPFVFQDEQYQFFRTTNIDAKGKPVMNVGSQAYDWASAMLGRDLGIDERLNPSELRGARMSAMVVWEKQKTDPTKKTIKLASLRHVAKSGNAPAAPAPPQQSRAQVEANATAEDIDRALMIEKFEKKLARARKRKLASLDTFEGAYAQIDQASTEHIEAWIDNLDDELDALP